MNFHFWSHLRNFVPRKFPALQYFVVTYKYSLLLHYVHMYVRMSDRAYPIARALDLKADVVITGRCVDSALVLGPLIHKVNMHSCMLAHVRANTEEWCVFTPGAYLTTISCYSYNISVYSACGTYKCWEKLIN